MIFDFGAFSIDVDVEQTKKYYLETERTLTEGCDCVLCRNFMAAYDCLDANIRQFFDSLGVEICKAADMTTMHGDKERNIMHYEGWCHICGRIVDGGMEEKQDFPRPMVWHRTPEYALSPACTVQFTTKRALVEDTFPEPVLQMEVSMEIPWVMGGHFAEILGW